MTEKVLTDEEVGALLDGVESGEVEVQSAQGPRYASVSPFEIPRRSRLASKSYPTLELLNDKFANRLRKTMQHMLNYDLGLACGETTGTSFGDICGQHSEVVLAVEFSAAPLAGRGAIVFEAALIHQLVELFFGGRGGELKAPGVVGFTLGELRVIRTFSDIVLRTLREIWEPIQAIDPEQLKTESSINLLSIADDTDTVIQCSFDFTFEDHDGALHVLLPHSMVEPLLPLFKGVDRKKDPAQDEMWAGTIGESLMNIDVRLSTNVGHASMTLGELICLEPGDIINIDSPRIATIYAQNVPLIDGRFGVHAGRNAVEATQWRSAGLKNKLKKDGTNG